MATESASTHDVFISYATEDKSTADAVCHALEEEGIRCWIAPRDVRPGKDWKPAVVSAIEECEVMVLIFSGRSNESSQVQTEVELAFESGHPIVPLRIEDEEMDDRLKYCVGSKHWLDVASGSIDDHVDQILSSIQMLTGQTQSEISGFERSLGKEGVSKKEVDSRNKGFSLSFPAKMFTSLILALLFTLIASLVKANTGISEEDAVKLAGIVWILSILYLFIIVNTRET